MRLWFRGLALAALGLPALGLGGCAFFEKPYAVEELVTRELPPLKQRVAVLEEQVTDNQAALEGKANRDDAPNLAEFGKLQTLAELQTNLLVSIARTVETHETAIDTLRVRDQQTEQRVASTEQKLAVEATRGQERARTQMLLIQLKLKLAATAGVSADQIEHAELVGFSSGKAQLERLLAHEPKARERLDTVRTQLGDGKIKLLQIAAFEDQAKCPPGNEECATVGLRRGLSVAEYLGAPRALVTTGEPTDRWGSPRENRRVVVFYVKQGAAPPPGQRKP